MGDKEISEIIMEEILNGKDYLIGIFRAVGDSEVIERMEKLLVVKRILG